METPRVVREFHTDQASGRVCSGDALLFMRELASGSAALVFLDPPFNLNKVYCDSHRKLDSRLEPDYEEWLRELILEAGRVLMPGGALYLYHLPIWAMRLGAVLDERLTFRHWIAISMKNGFARGSQLYPAHYALLYFTKGKPAHFNRPKLAPLVCRHCGGMVRDYGGYRKIIEEKGVNLSDFWDDLSPVRHQNKKHRTANELPQAFFDRVLAISGVPGLLYVDPFAGAGSGVLAAANAGMTFEACDLVEANCSIICARVEKLSVPSAIG